MALVRGESSKPNEPAVHGKSTATDQGMGVMGEATRGSGVIGMSIDWIGVYGESKGFNGVLGSTTADGHAGVAGVADSGNSNGIYGRSKNANGVVGYSSATGHSGVAGVNEDGDGPGVYGRSKNNEGVHAETLSSTTAAIAAYNLNPAGTGAAIYAEHKGSSIGVLGKSNAGVGLWGVSAMHEGVHAETNSQGTAAIAAYNLNPTGTGAAIFAKKSGSEGHAGFFDGNVFVTGDINCHNADCAEDFDIADANAVEPGTVLVVNEEGKLQHCFMPYDKRVVGVVSGAGGYRPGIVLDKQPTQHNRKPIALLGKVYCKVDASNAPIDIGDLLTTSGNPGHAMKTTDVQKAFGAVIGKALEPLKHGQGLIPILVALQ